MGSTYRPLASDDDLDLLFLRPGARDRLLSLFRPESVVEERLEQAWDPTDGERPMPRPDERHRQLAQRRVSIYPERLEEGQS